jgi:predicted negative regulator of RcsB-dependent stress response
MEHDVAQSAYVYRLWAWFETNRKQVLLGTTAVVLVGFVVSFYVWHQGEKEVSAGEALSNALVTRAVSGDAAKEPLEPFLKVAADYPGTSAGARALLDAGAALFTEAKYAEARAQFQHFLRDYSGSPFSGQALLGVAACFDAEGKTNDAFTTYKNLADQHPTENVAPQAKFALARIYESQNKMEQALNLYEELGRANAYSSLGAEAGMRAEELKLMYPKLAPVVPTAPALAPGSPPAITHKP